MAETLSDPEFEPSDEQLVALARDAFANVAQQRRAVLLELRSKIAALRAEALARLENAG
jgi:hypothetical protein